MGKIVKIFIGGGGDDWVSHIVENYKKIYAERNPGYDCRYFRWTETGPGIAAEMQRCGDAEIAKFPADAAITIVGHSYSGDTAFFAIRQRMIDTLISIDPVGAFQASWAAVRPHCRMWLNVRTDPDKQRWTRDDVIAAIGGKYPPAPKPGQPGAPNFSFSANQSHGQFDAMMRHVENGVSGRMLLGGRVVG